MSTAHADHLLLLYGATLFSVGYVITVFTHSLWFAAALAYVWWFQNTVLAKFRAPEIITTQQSDIFIYAPLCLLLGVAMALSLLWLFSTSTVTLLSVDAWRVIAPINNGNAKQTVFRLTNWATIGFMLAILAIAVSINFLTAEFSPDFIASEQLSIIIGIFLIIGGVSVIILVYVLWYLEGGATRSLTPRFNILYSLLFIGWLVLPPLIHHLIDADNSVWRFFATEVVLTILLIVTIIAERPYVTLSKAHEGDNDIRYVVASRMPMQKHVLRWALLLWFPLTIVYIAAAIAHRLSTLTTALLIFTVSIFFVAVLFTFFFVRSAASAAGNSGRGIKRTDSADYRSDDPRPPPPPPSSQASPAQQQHQQPKRIGSSSSQTNTKFDALEV